MNKWLLLILTSHSLTANFTPSHEFIDYHVNVAVREIDDQDTFDLIQELVNTLPNRSASDNSANELLSLIIEGYKIDPFNLAKLIETLTYKDASNNATKVIIAAIEHGSPITADHLSSLILTLDYADASNNATKVLLKAIEYGIPFGPKERLLLTEMSKMANAKKNVEKIRKALHERATKSIE